MSRHLGCFHILALASNAAVNVAVQMLLQDSAFSSSAQIPKSITAGAYGLSVFNLGCYRKWNCLDAIINGTVFVFLFRMFIMCV